MSAHHPTFTLANAVYSKIAEDATDRVAHNYRLKVRSIQQAHAIWRRWIGYLADVYEEDRQASLNDIMRRARRYLPTATEAKDVSPLVFEHDVIVYEADSDSGDSSFSVLPNAPANTPRASTSSAV